MGLKRLNEVHEYLKVKEPDVMGLVETTLSDQGMPTIGDGKYNVWGRKRNGRRGDGVILIVKTDMINEDTIKGVNKAEVLKLGIKKDNKKRDFVIARVPPKTNAWATEEYETVLTQTLKCLIEMTEVITL